ncbi:MAG: glycosyltransferase [Chloroflexia bacterium]|nr:glycosyltransferase [Chloroflexia bacterium]
MNSQRGPEHSPKVSVIISSYNYARFVGEALQSVAAQTWEDYEIIVVDDGSTDETRAAVERSGVPCQYIYQENQGAAAARNTGLRAARGEYVNFLDADDLLYPQSLELMAGYLDQHPDVALVYGDAIYFYQDGSGRPTRRFSRGLRTPPYPPSGNMLEVLVINSVFNPAAGLVRKSRVLDVDGFKRELRYAEDYDLWLRMAAQGYTFAYIDQAVAKYRIHGRNKIFVQPQKRLRSLVKIWDQLTQSEAFQALDPQVKALFYMHVAKANIWGGQARSARQALRQALEHNPRLYKAYLALTGLIFGTGPMRILLALRRQAFRNLRRWFWR